MTTINLGRVGFVNKGTYSGATAYKVNDVVVYNGGTYACIQANTGEAPSNASYWQNWVADNAVHKTGDETIEGVKTFSSSPLLPVPTLVNQAISMGNIVEKTGAVMGYGTGSGGTVTQLISKSAAVTLNKPSGYIRTNSASLAAGATIFFQFNNTLFNYPIDNMVVTSSNPANYNVTSGGGATGYTNISITNKTGSTLSEELTINFAIIKGAIA